MAQESSGWSCGSDRPTQDRLPERQERRHRHRWRDARTLRRPNSGTRQPKYQRAGSDNEMQWRLEGQGLAVNADFYGHGRAHLELGRGPVIPAGELPSAADRLERGKLLGLRSRVYPDKGNAQHAAVETLAHASAPQACQLVRVVRDEQQLGGCRFLA